LTFRLTCITAHPDDESGAFGGALSMAHAQGVETSVLCLTEGRAAANRGEAKSDEELGQMRRVEFEAAGAVLNVTHGELLNYPDGGLVRENFYALAGEMVARIRRWRPQVVLTWGTEGGVNLHADHTLVCLAATAAFHWAGRAVYFPEDGLAPYAPQKLYYSSPPFLLARKPEEAEGATRSPYSLVLELGEHWKQKKLEAFSKHDTQSSLLERVRHVFEEHASHEYYLLAAARTTRNATYDTALFAGVDED
jgi:LmbE family N-acetylglucosaminyl deacetylase